MLIKILAFHDFGGHFMIAQAPFSRSTHCLGSSITLSQICPICLLRIPIPTIKATKHYSYPRCAIFQNVDLSNTIYHFKLKCLEISVNAQSVHKSKVSISTTSVIKCFIAKLYRFTRTTLKTIGNVIWKVAEISVCLYFTLPQLLYI